MNVLLGMIVIPMPLATTLTDRTSVGAIEVTLETELIAKVISFQYNTKILHFVTG
jgi:hypothetical protein